MSEKPDDMVADDAGAPSVRQSVPEVVPENGQQDPVADSEADLAVTGGQDEDRGTPTQLRLRRAPRYRPFGLTGAFIGVVAGVVLALSFTATSDYSMQTIAGYFAAMFGLLGLVLGLGVAVLIERRHARRGRSAQAQSERGRS